MPLPPVSFPSLGWQVIDFIEAYLCHGPGDVQGERWTADVPGLGIDDEEALFICWLYRVWPQDHKLAGRRLAHRGVYSRPKGRRKSELAGALMCAEALGPVRCDGFDARGEPVGVPVRYPFIRCMATEEEQPLALDTPVPTPQGWTTVGQIELGDEVFSRSGEVVPVCGVTPVRRDDPCYRVVFSDGAILVASGAHQWTLERRTYNSVRRSFDYPEVTVATSEIAATIRDGGGTARYRTRFATLNLPHRELLVDPYLLGLWLGDGTTRNGGIAYDGQDRAEAVALVAAAAEPYESISVSAGLVYVRRRRRLCKWGHDWSDAEYRNPKTGDLSCGICRRKRRDPSAIPVWPTFMERLRTVGVLGNKHIPMDYLRASAEQRLALLQGLMDSDGNIDSPKGRCTFTTTLESLATGAAELLRTLGVKPSIRVKPNCWRIQFTPDSRHVFRLSRKVARQRSRSERSRTAIRHIVKVEPVDSVPVACVRLSDPEHLLLVGEHMVPTHNSANTYDNVVYMLTEGEAANAYRLDIGRSIESSTRVFIKEAGGGEIRPSTSGDASKDGGKESSAVADETHIYTTRQLRAMYRTVARNTGKRAIAEPLMLDTTTAWQPGERSIAEQAADRYAKLDVEQCLIKHGVLYDHRQGDEPKRFGDDRSLIKAMRPGYGPAAEWMDFGRIVKIIRDAEDPEADAYRYFLNRPRAASSHWLLPDEISSVLDSVDVPRGAKITAGFDGSENNDHTALMGCTEGGDLFTVGIWTPSGDELGWREEVNQAVDWLFQTFKMVRFYGDPPWWQEEMGHWAADHGSPPVVEFWTNIDSKMAVACGALRTAVRQRGVKIDPAPRMTEEIKREGKTLLAWHFENARTRKVKIKFEDRAEEAHVVRKDRPGSQLKIDSVTSSVLARRARDDALKAGEFDEPEYGRWTDGSTKKAAKVSKDAYVPCVGCGKPIHPKLHEPGAAEQGLCVRCRSRR